jgi:maltose alpha-D-glucosyltransferase/alpha-amylase
VTLCLFQEVIENIGDAWKVTCGLLERLAEHPASSEAHSQLMELADRLGDRIARLHNSLGSGAEAEFSSEPIRAEDAASWVHDICLSATRVLDELADHSGPLSRRLVARREDVIAEIRELSSFHVRGRKIRLHGDLHLGQVLVTTDDVYIIDFEGEPLRPFDQRREKFSPMKDVAGLLRSFDYARAATDRHAVSVTGAHIAEIVEEAKRTLWNKYILRAPALVGDLTDAKKLLRMFLYEKTFYEIEYELANRPDWVEIPVCDALDLLDEDIGLRRDDGIMVR